MFRILAFVRQDLRTAFSYRLNALFSVAGLLATVVPVYFVAKVLQPVMAKSIQAEGGEYFAFVLVGMVGLRLAMAGVNSLPTTFWSSIRTGTLESLFADSGEAAHAGYWDDGVWAALGGGGSGRPLCRRSGARRSPRRRSSRYGYGDPRPHHLGLYPVRPLRGRAAAALPDHRAAVERRGSRIGRWGVSITRAM